MSDESTHDGAGQDGRKPIDTHGMTIEFGRHSGTAYTRIPVSYLRWMVNSRCRDWQVAAAELERRGFVEPPSLEVSGHAIDRASLRCQQNWKDHRRRIGDDHEGLHTWLMRVAAEALALRVIVDGRYVHPLARVSLVIIDDLEWPVVKTVFPAQTKTLRTARRTMELRGLGAIYEIPSALTIISSVPPDTIDIVTHDDERLRYVFDGDRWTLSEINDEPSTKKERST